MVKAARERKRESRRRAGRAYQEGGKALAKVPKKILRKLEKPRRGPPAVAKHHGNGAVATQKSPCAAENTNARRLGPFFEHALPLEAGAAKWHLGGTPLQVCSPNS